jgi:hypothetical protein
MNEIFHYEFATSLLGKAQATLASATTLAAALLACNQARAAYDTARGAVRETEFKCSGFVSNCYQVMANAIEIEARAQCRLADEYDAAQERGEVTRRRQYHHPMTMKEIGLDATN